MEHGYTKAERGSWDRPAPRSHSADSLTEQRLRVVRKREKEEEVVGEGDRKKRKRDEDLEERVCSKCHERGDHRRKLAPLTCSSVDEGTIPEWSERAKENGGWKMKEGDDSSRVRQDST